MKCLLRKLDPRKSIFGFYFWTLFIGLLSIVEKRDPHLIYADPFSGTVLISLALSAAFAAGNYGLQMLMASRQKGQKIDRGKLDDVRISTSEYGAAIPKVWGTVRLAPNWFWHTPVEDRPVVTQGQSGGKGGPPPPPTPTVTEHVYYTNIAGSLCDNEIQGVSRIWFDTDLVYNTSVSHLSFNTYEAEAGSNTLSGATVASDSECSGGQKVTGISSGNYCQINGVSGVVGSYSVAVYYKCTSDVAVSVSVNGGAGTNYTFPGAASGVSVRTFPATLTTGSSNTIRFTNSSAANFEVDKIQIVRAFNPSGDDGITDIRSFTGLINPNMNYSVTEDSAWPSYNYEPSPSGTGVYSANLAKYGQPQIRIYTGTETQTADSAIVADKGAPNAPAYRGVSYLVIEGLQLQNGRVPNVTVEVIQGTTALSDIVEDHFTLVGVDSANLDLTELSGDTVTGWALTSRQPAAESGGQLQIAYQFDLVELDGKVYAVKRNGSSSLTIPYSELRAHNYGDEVPPADATITDLDPLSLPARVDVNYLDPELDYHNNTQSDFELVSSGAQDNVTVNLPWVASKDEAKALARIMRTKPHLEGRTFQFSTTAKYAKLYPGKVVTLTLPNATHIVRVTDMKMSLPPGLVEFEAVRHQASIYSPTANGSVPTLEAPVVAFPGNSKGVIIDGPLLRPEDAGDGTQPILYIAACGRGDGNFAGGFLYQERPAGSDTYELVTTFTQAGNIGVTTGTLASVSDPSMWDRTSSLTIDFFGPTTLSSYTEAELTQNASLNLLWVGSGGSGEYIQFANATAGTPASGYQKRWTVSTFLRGQFGTEANVSTHTSTDDVVVIDSTVKPRRFTVGDIGRAHGFKFVTSGQAVADAAAFTQTINGASLKPLAPVNASIVRNVAGDALVQWARRTRLAQGMRPGVNVPLAEEMERYEVDVMNGADTVRTLTAVGDETRSVIWASTGNIASIPAADGSWSAGPYGFTSSKHEIGAIAAQKVSGSFRLDVTDGESAGVIPIDRVPTTLSIGPFSLVFGGASATAEGLSAAQAYDGGTVFTMIGRNGRVEYYKDYQGPQSTPFYTSLTAYDPFRLYDMALAGGASTLMASYIGPARLSSISPSVLYTAAMQTADFGSTQSSITVRIYQASMVVGRGPGLEYTG